MLPPFTVQSEDNRAMARHCTVGIEPRISAERLILLDTQVRHFLFYNYLFRIFQLKSSPRLNLKMSLFNQSLNEFAKHK